MNKNALNTFYAVARELAALAKASVPKLREGESVKTEWLKDGAYYRETIFNGQIYRAAFDFIRRTSRVAMILCATQLIEIIS